MFRCREVNSTPRSRNIGTLSRRRNRETRSLAPTVLRGAAGSLLVSLLVVSLVSDDVKQLEASRSRETIQRLALFDVRSFRIECVYLASQQRRVGVGVEVHHPTETNSRCLLSAFSRVRISFAILSVLRRGIFVERDVRLSYAIDKFCIPLSVCRLIFPQAVRIVRIYL